MEDLDNQYTALMYAARGGFHNIVRFLHKHGAALDLQNAEGQTALHRATGRGELKTVCELLVLGADKEMQDLEGKTARDWAIEYGHYRIAEIFKIWDTPEDFNRSMLEAAKDGNEILVRGLLMKGADINHSENGETAFNHAARLGHTAVLS